MVPVVRHLKGFFLRAESVSDRQVRNKELGERGAEAL